MGNKRGFIDGSPSSFYFWEMISKQCFIEIYTQILFLGSAMKCVYKRFMNYS